MGLALSRLRILLAACLGSSRDNSNAAAAMRPAGAGRPVHAPPTVHATLAADPKCTRTIVVGDVHGCLGELHELLEKVEYTPAHDRVVLVGDLVNKGPGSAECVRYARTAGHSVVRGNHDDAALFAWEERHAARRRGDAVELEEPHSRKYAYTDRFDAEDVAFLRGLPYTLLLEEADGPDPSLVVHAGLVPGLALAEHDLEDLYTMRNLVPRGEGGAWAPRAAAGEGVSWASQWVPQPAAPGGPRIAHVYFGHDAKRGLQLAPHATGLDTGACYGRELTCCVLPERKLVSVKARRMYAQPKAKAIADSEQ